MKLMKMVFCLGWLVCYQKKGWQWMWFWKWLEFDESCIGMDIYYGCNSIIVRDLWLKKIVVVWNIVRKSIEYVETTRFFDMVNNLVRDRVGEDLLVYSEILDESSKVDFNNLLIQLSRWCIERKYWGFQWAFGNLLIYWSNSDGIWVD